MHKEAKALKQELSTNMAKIQNLMVMKQKLENETNDIRKRLEEAEAEQDLAFNQMSQEQFSDTNHEIADQWIIDVLTSEAAIKPIVDTYTTEIITSETALGDSAQFRAMMGEKLGQHLLTLIRAASMQRTQQTDPKRTKHDGSLELSKHEIMEIEPEEVALP